MTFLLLPLLALAAEALPHRPPPSVAPALVADTEAQWVPFDLTPGNQIRFTMSVNGGPVTAILDTGVSYSLLAKRYTDATGAKTRPGGVATAIGGAVDIEWVDTDTIALGGLRRRGGGLTVAALPAIATGSAEPVDLLVGRDLTGRFAIDIDYAAKRFRLLASGRMPFRGIAAPLSISRERLVYVGEIMLGATRARPMIVDTGDGSSVTVTAAGWRTARLSAPIAAVPTTTTIAFGLGGAATSILAIIPELRTGQLTARNVEVRVEPAGGFSESIGVAGRIGSGFLQNYRVLLDPTAGRMILQPGDKADEPPLRSTSGLLVGFNRDRLRVLHVMRGGPAEAGGWREGDTICTIDGAPIGAAYPTSPIATWSAGEPGRIVALGLCNGATRKLTLRRFY